MKVLLAVAAIALASATSAWAQSEPRTEAEARLRLLPKVGNPTRAASVLYPVWCDSVERHVPGDRDAAVLDISRWPGEDLDALLNWTWFLLTASDKQRKVHHLPPLGFVAAAVKRGTLLHADVALLLPFDPSRPPQRLRSSPRPQYVVEVLDGQRQGGAWAGAHLEIGRALLALLREAGFADAEYESLWYRATSARLLQSRQNGYAEPHLRVGLEVLPRDARLLFYSGALHEDSAAPHMQRGVETTNLPAGFMSAVRSARDELESAEKMMRRALQSDPANLEVRLHHGRVLGQLGRHADAAGELAAVDGKFTDRELAYYAALFRGEEEAELGRREVARDGFARAASLFPSAQSPLVALSRLARRYGDRAGAVAALRRLLALPTDERERVDPWWAYDLSYVRDADALMTELYGRFAQEGTR